MAKIKIYVTSKKGILDPAGRAVESALHSLGYKAVANVHIGKYIELELSGSRPVREQVEEMCRKLLANPVIEDYHFEVLEK
jgi:phosphoribosylformylglycinamidine synthase